MTVIRGSTVEEVYLDPDSKVARHKNGEVPAAPQVNPLEPAGLPRDAAGPGAEGGETGRKNVDEDPQRKDKPEPTNNA